MAFTTTLTNSHTFSCLSSQPKTTRSNNFPLQRRLCVNVKAVNASQSETADNKQKTKETKTQDSSNTQPSSPPPKKPSKPVFSMKKGQIVRVDKEQYLNSINYLSVGHPPYYKGLDYIYEDRGEVLDLRIFETGEYALVSWVGIPTSPAWLPTDMLIKSDKLNYERM